jgi:hypothetical protein
MIQADEIRRDEKHRRSKDYASPCSEGVGPLETLAAMRAKAAAISMISSRIA